MDERKNIFLTVFFSAILLGFVLSEPGVFSSDDGLSQVENVGLSENLLSVSTLCYRMDMSISNQQAETLQQELHNRDFERPQTHEIISEASDRQINRVEIHSLENNSYHADLIIGGGLTEKRIDVRPSDGVLLASSNDVPVFINDQLIQENGVNQCLDGSTEI